MMKLKYFFVLKELEFSSITSPSEKVATYCIIYSSKCLKNFNKVLTAWFPNAGNINGLQGINSAFPDNFIRAGIRFRKELN